MEQFIRIVAGVLLIAHGLVHLLYFVPNPDQAKWPFTVERSWLLGEAVRRPVLIALVAVTVGGFALLAASVWGVPWVSAAWPVFAIVGAGASLAALLLFWDTQLLFGVALSLAVLVTAVWRPAWTAVLG